MNYRHAFHAGNFADVLKHIVIVQSLKLMQQKEAGICILDAFAGVGIYNLKGEISARSPEYIDGIQKLWQSGEKFAPIVMDYLEILDKACQSNKDLYAGSPFLMASMARTQDRIILNELHPNDFEILRENMHEFNFKGAAKIEVSNIDAWQIIKAKLPPKERRGLIIIDPPFEKPNEFERMINAVKEGQKRFATGVYVLWHANKNDTQTNQYRASLLALGQKMLWVQMRVKNMKAEKGLASAGLCIINPPFGLENALKEALRTLNAILAQDKYADFEIRAWDKA